MQRFFGKGGSLRLPWVTYCSEIYPSNTASVRRSFIVGGCQENVALADFLF
jgi:hypothetical protein